MIKAIIFDMDGVIINTQKLYDIYEFNLFKEITNNKWSYQDQLSIHGRSYNEIYNILKNKYRIKLSKIKYYQKYEIVHRFVYGKECKLITGVIKLIKDLYSKKYILALASSTSHKYINKVLEKFELHKYFKTIVSGDDTNGKSKPEPDIFLLTAKKLKINPKECLVIEDSNNGVTAAKRAGMYCIQYNRLKKKEPPYPDVQITTFKKLLISKIIKNIDNLTL